MKPIIILPPKAMSPEDIEMLRANEICVVVSENPALVKFVDPIPAASNRTQIEDAAIKLSRKILSTNYYDDNTRGNFSRMYIELLMKGTPLDSSPSQQEQEKAIFDNAKRDELSRLAREEAKAERQAAKNSKAPASK